MPTRISDARRSGLLAVAAFLFAAGPALAGPAACTCRNLESLQQDYQNAVFLEGYMRGLAAHLKAEEDRLTGLQLSSNIDPDHNVMIISRTANMRDAYERQNLRLPFEKVKDYTGPDRVPMPFGTCAQLQADLDALEAGSPCEAIADAALAHELGHRDFCNQMGATVYWDRPMSALALEEAGLYKLQAANLKAELRRVLDTATVELKGEVLMTVTVPQMMETSYRFVTRSGDIGGASGGDTWTMAGKGQNATSIEKAVIGGMNCRPSGAVNAEFDVALQTDGVTFGLELQGRVTGGSPAISCPGGMGMGFPPPDPVRGRIASGQPLREGDNVIGGDFSAPLQGAMAGMGSVTSEGQTVLSVTCPAQ